MNIVDIYRIKNNKFNWTELFQHADESQLNMIQTLLTAERQRRTRIVFDDPTPWQTTWGDKTWQVPGHISSPNYGGSVYIGDPIPTTVPGHDITVRWDGSTVGTIQGITTSDRAVLDGSSYISYDAVRAR